MEIVKTMYLLDVVRNLSMMLTIVLIIGLCAVVSLVILYIFLKTDDSRYAGEVRTWLVRSTIIMGICAVILLFCPSKATLYTYAGLKTAEVLLESDTGKALTAEAKEVLVDVKKIVHNYAVELGKESSHE